MRVEHPRASATRRPIYPAPALRGRRAVFEEVSDYGTARPDIELQTHPRSVVLRPNMA